MNTEELKASLAKYQSADASDLEWYERKWVLPTAIAGCVAIVGMTGAHKPIMESAAVEAERRAEIQADYRHVNDVELSTEMLQALDEQARQRINAASFIYFDGDMTKALYLDEGLSVGDFNSGAGIADNVLVADPNGCVGRIQDNAVTDIACVLWESESDRTAWLTDRMGAENAGVYTNMSATVSED